MTEVLEDLIELGDALLDLLNLALTLLNELLLELNLRVENPFDERLLLLLSVSGEQRSAARTGRVNSKLTGAPRVREADRRLHGRLCG